MQINILHVVIMDTLAGMFSEVLEMCVLRSQTCILNSKTQGVLWKGC